MIIVKCENNDPSNPLFVDLVPQSKEIRSRSNRLRAEANDMIVAFAMLLGSLVNVDVVIGRRM